MESPLLPHSPTQDDGWFIYDDVIEKERGSSVPYEVIWILKSGWTKLLHELVITEVQRFCLVTWSHAGTHWATAKVILFFKFPPNMNPCPPIRASVSSPGPSASLPPLPGHKVTQRPRGSKNEGLVLNTTCIYSYDTLATVPAPHLQPSCRAQPSVD